MGGKVILSINSGSSSLKVSIFNNTALDPSGEPKQLADIQISNLTAPPAKLKYTRGDSKVKGEDLPDVKGSQAAYEYIIDYLIKDPGLAELQHVDDVDFACHRVVHGGDFTEPARVDKDTYHRLEELSTLAPLHNAAALEIVKAVHEKCPTATNIAFFDSAFHHTLPPEVYTYAIDPERAQKKKLRKYGFHGLSYAFIFRSCVSYLRSYPPDTNLIALHLGSGASICCIKGGKSIDTTMGLTPLAGLPGATRSGDIDPSLVFHLTPDAGKPAPSSTKDLHLATGEEILNKDAGWQALTGTTDFGDISAKAKAGDAKCKLAFDILVDRIVGYVASYFVKLNGEVHAVVFAGGIGEQGAMLRDAVMAKIKFLGFAPDYKANENPPEGRVVDVGWPSAQHRVLVCRTDEQLEMARQCLQDADKLRRQ